MSTRDQQARWRQSTNSHRVEVNLSPEEIEILDELASEVDEESEKPLGRSGAIRRLLAIYETLPVDEGEPVALWKVDPVYLRDKRCQASNRDGSRCKGHGNVLETMRLRCAFAVCTRHSNHFSVHPSSYPSDDDE